MQTAGHPRHALSMSDNIIATARQHAPALPGGEKRSAGVEASGRGSVSSATGSDSRPIRRARASTLLSGVTTWCRPSRTLGASALTCGPPSAVHGGHLWRVSGARETLTCGHLLQVQRYHPGPLVQHNTTQFGWMKRPAFACTSAAREPGPQCCMSSSQSPGAPPPAAPLPSASVALTTTRQPSAGRMFM